MRRYIKPLTLLLSMFVLLLTTSCGVQTLKATDQSANGGQLGENSNANIMIGDPGNANIPTLPVISNSTLSEIYEEGRGNLVKVGSRISTLTGSISYFSALTNTASSRTGVFLQGDLVLTTNSLQVRIFASQDSGAVTVANGLIALENQVTSRLVNKISNVSNASSLQTQGSNLAGIQSIILVCDDDGVSEICASADLSTEPGLAGNTDWDDIAHVASGGYRIYRDPSNFNLIFQTNSNYSADDGPNLFFYISKVAHTAAVGNNDARYNQPGTSIVIDPTNPIANNSGVITKPIPGSAAERLSEYKTMSLWCEAFSVLFNISEILSI